MRIGYLPQILDLDFDLNSLKNLPDKFFKEVGIQKTILNKKFSCLSEGEKVKILLLELSFNRNYDLYLLDEPTNNLDITGIFYLEKFLSQTKRTMIFVSHDRSLLEMMDRILEIDSEDKKIKNFGGNYSFYKKMKDYENEARWRKYKVYEEKKEDLLESLRFSRKRALKIEKNSKDAFYKAKAAKIMSQIKAQEKRIERELNNLQQPELPKPPKFYFPQVKDDENLLLFLKNVFFKYEDETIIQDFDLKIYKGDKIAIVGPNGTGKTTLLKLITGDLESEEGTIYLTEDVKIGYLHQTIESRENIKIKDWLHRKFKFTKEIIKKNLGLLLLDDCLNKSLKEISNGDLRKIFINSILMIEPNLLILDEPTNHLDIYTIESLEKVLKFYKGGLVIVTYDRYLLEKIGINKIFKFRFSKNI